MTPVATKRSVLLIEDNDEHAAILTRHLRQVEGGIVLSRASCLADGLLHLESNTFDALLLDLQLPDSPIEQTLSRTLPHASQIPILVMSSLEEREFATNALKAGAQDYICKAHLSSELLYRAIEYAIERKRTERRIRDEAFRKQALFELSQHALSEKVVSQLLEETARTVSQALRTDFVKIMEFLPAERSFIFRAGVGWKENLTGRIKVSGDLNSIPGYTLRASRPTLPGNLNTLEPVIFEDLKTDPRFSPAPFVIDHGITSGISVIIHGKDQDIPYGVLTASTASRRYYSRDEAQFLQAAANTLAAALLRIQLEQELVCAASDLKLLNAELEDRVSKRTHALEESQARLRALTVELNLAEQRERTRVATDLHDYLQQSLVLAKLKLGKGKQLSASEPTSAGLFREADDLLTEALSYTRTLVSELSPPVLRQFGLPAALKWLGDWMQHHDLAVSVECDDQEVGQLVEEHAGLIFQSVRELLINSAKHAKTDHAVLRLTRSQDELCIEVLDEGVGFDPAPAGTSPANGSYTKFGLFSIHERMRALGGDFSIRSSPGNGTMATLRLPWSDVGPVVRRFLTRADDFFGDLLSLTLVEKLIRGQVPE